VPSRRLWQAAQSVTRFPGRPRPVRRRRPGTGRRGQHGDNFVAARPGSVPLDELAVWRGKRRPRLGPPNPRNGLWSRRSGVRVPSLTLAIPCRPPPGTTSRGAKSRSRSGPPHWARHRAAPTNRSSGAEPRGPRVTAAPASSRRSRSGRGAVGRRWRAWPPPTRSWWWSAGQAAMGSRASASVVASPAAAFGERSNTVASRAPTSAMPAAPRNAAE
jgi:hypothetical protein